MLIQEEELKSPGEEVLEGGGRPATPERQDAASLDALIQLAQEVNRPVAESPAAGIQEKTRALKEKEAREMREAEDVRQIQGSFGAAGYSEYYGVKASETGDEATLMKFAQSEAASIRHQLESGFKASDYEWRLPEDVGAIANRFESVAAGADDKYARQALLKGTADIYRGEAGGGVRTYVERQRASLQEAEKKIPPLRPYKYQEKILSRVGGFGRAALENGDLEVAVDALRLYGSLEDSQVIAQLGEKIRSLKSSTRPEDNLLLQRVTKKLLEARGGQK